MLIFTSLGEKTFRSGFLGWGGVSQHFFKLSRLTIFQYFWYINMLNLTNSWTTISFFACRFLQIVLDLVEPSSFFSRCMYHLLNIKDVRIGLGRGALGWLRFFHVRKFVYIHFFKLSYAFQKVYIIFPTPKRIFMFFSPYQAEDLNFLLWEEDLKFRITFENW